MVACHASNTTNKIMGKKQSIENTVSVSFHQQIQCKNVYIAAQETQELTPVNHYYNQRS